MAVLEARSALRSGNAARSLQLLQEMNVRFPRGALGQEREALSIEALAQAGQTATAKRRAAAFLRVHPQSPYTVDVRRVAER
jgi:outer membrane protein assembly factor BamD (BamD/ComL family)